MKSFKLFLTVLLLLKISNTSAQSVAKLYDETADRVSQLKLQGDKDAVKAALAPGSWWRNSMEKRDERIKWYKEARFGMFIHWGVYSYAGGEWEGKPLTNNAEWLMMLKKLPVAVYKEKVVKNFNPVKFNAEEWVKLAVATGMRYMIITAKHHDGVAMFPSDAYPYDIRQTPFKRDPMMELRVAARKYHLKFGFYYSQANDWEHPDASGRNWDTVGNAFLAALKGSPDWTKYPQYIPRVHHYVDQKAIPQIKELATRYQPDMLWFDTPQQLPLSENLRILEAVRSFAPDVIVNGRLASFQDINFGDYLNTTDKPAYFSPQKDVWEGIPTTNNSYAYSKYDTVHKPASHFIELLAAAANKGGNLLLNIGPKGDGLIDEADLKILHGIGRWMLVNGESIHGTVTSPLSVQPWGESTYNDKDKKLYLEVKSWPQDGRLIVGGIHGSFNAYLLSDKNKRPLETRELPTGDLEIIVPKGAPDPVLSVVVLKLNSEPSFNAIRLLTARDTNVLQVFDAKLVGAGLTYGQGKVNSENIKNWKKPEQEISWTIRLNESAAFNISLAYNTDKPDQSGEVFLHIDDQVIPITYTPTITNRSKSAINKGTINLPTGQHTIKLTVGKYIGEQLMQPFNVTLVPLSTINH